MRSGFFSWSTSMVSPSSTPTTWPSKCAAMAEIEAKDTNS
jgi:hypothetical protein